MATAQEEALELQHEMSLLSPQEREAMGIDDGADELALLNELQDNGDTERQVISELPPAKEKAPEPDDKEEEDKPAEPPVEPEPEPEVAPEPTPEPTPEPEAKAEQPKPAQVDDFTYNAPPVEDYDGKIAAISAERAKAMKDLLAGEIDDADYAAIDERTLKAREDLNAAQNRYLMAEEIKEQRVLAQWNKGIADVKAEAKAQGIDYDNDPKMGAAWDRWVRALGADPENNDKPGDWFLKEAHKLVKLQYNFSDAAQNQPQTSQAKPDATPTKAAAPRPRTPDLSNIPPTLSNAPAAAIESEGEGGEFAYLDKLTGIARERALARLTPDQEARYLES